MATVSWGVGTYPRPSTLEEAEDFVGGVGVMADGSLVIDQVARKYRVRIVWQGLTLSEANSIYAQAVNHNAALMDMTNGGGGNYGNVIPIPNSVRKSAIPNYPVTYDVTVEVRTVDPLTWIGVGGGEYLSLNDADDIAMSQ